MPFEIPFEIQPLSLETTIAIARAVFLVFSFVIAAIAFTRWRRAAQRDTERVLAQMTTIAERFAEVEEGLASLDGRVRLLSQHMEAERLSAPAAASTSPSYQIAIRLARSGATHEELMEACGVTRQEAELMQRLHGQAKRQPVRAQSAVA
jgi:Protein of unknown function (DUF2802)